MCVVVCVTFNLSAQAVCAFHPSLCPFKVSLRKNVKKNHIKYFKINLHFTRVYVSDTRAKTTLQWAAHSSSCVWNWLFKLFAEQMKSENLKICPSPWFILDVASGVVGAAQGHPLADSWPVHVHVGSALSGHSSAANRRLDAADQVPATSRLRHLRVPGVDHSPHESLHSSECRW